jgi:hypothetical protein
MPDVAGQVRGRMLVFVHIPKTAGSTLRTVLGMNEPGPRSRALGNVFKGGGGISKALVERLRDGNGPDLRGVRLVRGHFPLGIREYLPAHLPKDRELRCFSFLREPADRTLSHFFAIRAAGRGYGLPPLPDSATLEDALAGGYLHDNLQTRMLSGQPEPFGEVDDEMLEQAKRNLSDGLAFFGLTERFDESLVLAGQRLGLRTILYRTSGRVNAARPRGKEVPAELLEAARDCNRYDIELYRHAVELFDQAPERDQLDFQIELAALRTALADSADPPQPAPPEFDGGDLAWGIVLDARVGLLRKQAELAGSEVRATAARARTIELKRQVEALDPSRVSELEQQVERLEAEAAKAAELARQVERLEAAAGRPKREARRESPRSARARRDRPKRNARHESSKRAEPPRSKGRRRGEGRNRRPRGGAGPGQGPGSDGG